MNLTPTDRRYPYWKFKSNENSHLLYLNYMESLYWHTFHYKHALGKEETDRLLKEAFGESVVRDAVEMLSDYMFLDHNYEGMEFKYTDENAETLWEKLPFDDTDKMRSIVLHSKISKLTLPGVPGKFVAHDGVWDGSRFYTWFELYYLNGITQT